MQSRIKSCKGCSRALIGDYPYCHRCDIETREKRAQARGMVFGIIMVCVNVLILFALAVLAQVCGLAQ